MDDLLTSVAAVIARTTDPERALGPTLRLLAEVGGVARAGLCIWDRRADRIDLIAAHGLTPAETRRMSWAPGHGVIGRAVQLGEPQVGSDLLAVPVAADGEILGAIAGVKPADPEASIERLRVVAGLLVPVALRFGRVQSAENAETEAEQPPEIIGRAKPMRALYQAISQVASGATTVLVLGESGTGKELVASAIHRGSDRARRPLVTVNVAALPETLVESELFGHEAGAFTGAQGRRKGRFELANGGTLFLDEIGDLAPASQVKLLRVLQEGEIHRVGSNKPIPVDVRIIAATSRDLDAMVEAGTFRVDLYYRLNVFPIRLPALRERRSDILLLADHFVERFNRAHGRQVKRISSTAIDMLLAYHWPGNVRELENCIERAVLVAPKGVIFGHHLPPTLQTGEASGTASEGSLKQRLQALEREIVLDTLKERGGNMAAAARTLGISERVMGLRVSKYGIDWRRYRRATPQEPT